MYSIVKSCGEIRRIFSFSCELVLFRLWKKELLAGADVAFFGRLMCNMRSERSGC